MFVNKKISKMQSKEVDTITGNRIIADFMEWVHHEDKSYDEYEMSNLKYHSSWDWLHPAWDKFRELKYDNEIYKRHISSISFAISAYPISVAFERMAIAIQWYKSILKKEIIYLDPYDDVPGQ